VIYLEVRRIYQPGYVQVIYLEARKIYQPGYVQVIYLEVRKIYQPGYSGGRGERQKIYLVLEYELSSVAAILCVTVRPVVFAMNIPTCTSPTYRVWDEA